MAQAGRDLVGRPYVGRRSGGSSGRWRRRRVGRRSDRVRRRCGGRGSRCGCRRYACGRCRNLRCLHLGRRYLWRCSSCGRHGSRSGGRGPRRARGKKNQRYKAGESEHGQPGGQPAKRFVYGPHPHLPVGLTAKRPCAFPRAAQHPQRARRKWDHSLAATYEGAVARRGQRRSASTRVNAWTTSKTTGAARAPHPTSTVAWYGRLTGEATAMTPRHPTSSWQPNSRRRCSGFTAAPTRASRSSRSSACGRPARPTARNARSSSIRTPPDAFNADYRPSYRPEAAKDGWARMLAWFRAHGVA